jgi:aminoglycoside phosphotransferase family enzyme/predicted kinase
MLSALRTSLARPAAFPAPAPRGVEVRETHVSIVFLGERDVYKVKKPVNLGFLDFRTAEQRRAACEAEVLLNARLAHGVYLGVVPVVCRLDGTFAFGGEGATVDWAVHMRRLPDASRADDLLSRGRLTPRDVEAVADRVALFHASARAGSEVDAYGAPEAISRNVVENFAQTRASLAAYLRADEAAEIERYQLSFLKREALFRRRIAQARIRDGHGDLRLEHVYFEDEGTLTIVDCIEFSDRFRFADVCSDLAFLAMDLAWHGRADLAERLLARYALVSGDYELYSVVDFYESYRAYVRGKVAGMLAADEQAEPSARQRARAEARRYFLLALAAPRRSLMSPILVCVGGVIASGKSTIAAAVAGELGAAVIEADRTRKEMVGVAHETHLTDPAWKGAYDLAFTGRVYEEVRRRAGVVLASGRPAVIDASFRSAAERAAVKRFALERGVPVRFIECAADPDVCRARLARREGGPSDGRLAVFDDFCARFEPFSELADAEHTVLDTSAPLEASLARVAELVPTWPRGLFS